ncbi:MAG: TolC family protein [Elusimicrobia bacterium]|nr:TolC family protein [Elusimicrobiota bacterium]
MRDLGSCLCFMFFVSIGRTEALLPSTGTLTLDVCYRLALERNESVALSLEEVRGLEGQYAQVRARILPRVGFFASERFEDTSGASGDARSDDPEARVYARQPLFHGMREISALKAQGENLRGRQEEVVQARILLYEDVAKLFYGLALADERIKTFLSLRRVSQDRLTELNRRVAIGRSRASEVLSSETQLARLEADLEDARWERASLGEMLDSLLGQRGVAVADTATEAVSPAPLETVLVRQTDRPDVRSALYDVKAYRYLEKSVRQSYWPTVDLGGNYYLKRAGSNENVNWDLLLALDFPFFRGGEYRGQTETAAADRRSAQWREALVRRLAEQEIRSRHLYAASALSRRDRLGEAARLALKNYAAQKEEYRLGLVSNLDVLAALNTMEETKLDHDRSRLEAKLALILLDLSVNALPEAHP